MPAQGAELGAPQGGPCEAAWCQSSQATEGIALLASPPSRVLQQCCWLLGRMGHNVRREGENKRQKHRQNTFYALNFQTDVRACLFRSRGFFFNFAVTAAAVVKSVPPAAYPSWVPDLASFALQSAAAPWLHRFSPWDRSETLPRGKKTHLFQL